MNNWKQGTIIEMEAPSHCFEADVQNIDQDELFLIRGGEKREDSKEIYGWSHEVVSPRDAS